MTCQRCLDEPCDRVRSTRRLLGAWAKERRRQAVGLLGALEDQAAMDDAIGASVEEAFSAQCSCSCHEPKQGCGGPAGAVGQHGDRSGR